MKKTIIYIITFVIILTSLIIITISNIDKKGFYSLKGDNIKSITSVVGNRDLIKKDKKKQNKQLIKTYSYNKINDPYTDLSIYINKLKESNFITTKDFDLNKKQGKLAYVYHDNKLLKKVDLNINKTYTFEGDKGEVIVTVKNKKIKVDKETSEYHFCSKMGYISKPHETIICLPNKIVIEIGGNEVDTVVR